ncbi:MAG: PH domain-containing protein [Clostridiales bacterium]|nr:PH domain-containing protein [Clostridiales bacterium]
MDYKTPSENSLKLMRITAGINAVIFGVVPGIVLLIYLSVKGYALWGVAVCGAAVVLALLFFLITPPIRFRRYKYLIADDRVEIIEGLFWIKRTIVPIDRIHQIDVKCGPLDTYVGVEKVTVTTAGSHASFRFLEPQVADDIAMLLNRRVGNIAKSKPEENGDV